MNCAFVGHPLPRYWKMVFQWYSSYRSPADGWERDSPACSHRKSHSVVHLTLPQGDISSSSLPVLPSHDGWNPTKSGNLSFPDKHILISKVSFGSRQTCSFSPRTRIWYITSPLVVDTFLKRGSPTDQPTKPALCKVCTAAHSLVLMEPKGLSFRPKEKFRVWIGLWIPDYCRLSLGIGCLSPLFCSWNLRAHQPGGPYTAEPKQMLSCVTLFSWLLHRAFFMILICLLAEVVTIVLLKRFNAKFW